MASSSDIQRPSVRTIPRAIRTAPLDSLRDHAQSARQGQQSHDANEWYWVSRFGHPLVDHINIHGFLSLRSIYAKNLTKEELEHLVPGDLAVLALSESVAARMTAASHHSTPSASFERLAKDADRDVRRAVGHNPATPAELIARMDGWSFAGRADDEVDGHRVAFLWTELETVPLDTKIALEVANGEHDDADRLALARRKHVPRTIRVALAESYAMTAEVAEILVCDKDESVRAALAANTKTPAEVLIQLAGDAEAAVRNAAEKNYKFPRADIRG